MSKPSNPQGTRDFSPEVMRKRNYLLDSIRSVFVKYGFEPLETPALENLDTLTGKYGDEGDKLLYKIRSNRSLAQEVSPEIAQQVEQLLPDRWIPGDSKLGLRYDLTVPFARFVVQHRNEITFPFRRYQIQPVWRADRPQKGRFREFTQCDADCIGSNSLLHEADLIRIYSEAFENMKLNNAVLRLNHRKFLEAIVDELDLDFPVARFTSTLDKLDKIGREGVSKELAANGVEQSSLDRLFDGILSNRPLSNDSLDAIAQDFNNNELAMIAVNELKQVVRFLGEQPLDIEVMIDLSLARGLDYYTGCIFEAIVPDSGIGSISGGGRYDDLTGVFGLKDVSGVGISFGIDRIYEIMEQSNGWPEGLHHNSSVLIGHFDTDTQVFGVGVSNLLRAAGINTIVYPDQKRINKQFDFANKVGIRYVVVIGEVEMKSGMLTIKDMVKGEQYQCQFEEAVEILKGEEA